MKFFSRLTKQQSFLLLTVLATLLVPFLIPGPAHAATLTEASIQLYRMGAAVAAN